MVVLPRTASIGVAIRHRWETQNPVLNKLVNRPECDRENVALVATSMTKSNGSREEKRRDRVPLCGVTGARVSAMAEREPGRSAGPMAGRLTAGSSLNGVMVSSVHVAGPLDGPLLGRRKRT